MELTRGDFLRSLAIGVGGAVTGLTAFGADGSQVPGLRWHSGRNETLLVDLTKETFERLLNTTFRVMDKSTPTVVDVQLVEVSEGRSASDFEQFSILFHGPAEPVLPQRTYSVQHAELGDFDLFLVPVAASQSRAEYEAVFSRMNR
jgi:hypothetical protein